MVKIIMIPIMCSLILSGCGKDAIKINTDVKEQKIDIIYCPAPPEIPRPVLPIHMMTAEEERSDGAVVQYYRATVNALIGYSRMLEKVIDNQKQINTAYEEKRKELELSEPTTE